MACRPSYCKASNRNFSDIAFVATTLLITGFTSCSNALLHESFICSSQQYVPSTSSNEFLSFYAAHGKRRWTRDIGEVFRHDARGRDEFDEEEDYEKEARLRRGRQRRTIVKGNDEDNNSQRREEDDESFYFDDSFDVDEFLKSETGKETARRPMALDMADPGRTIDRWPELLKDKAALRDLAIVGVLIWFIEFIDHLPIPIEMVGPDVVDIDPDLMGINNFLH